MKYKVILPVALPAVLVLSVLYMVQGRLETRATYNNYLQAAQEYEKNGVVTDAVAAYEAALALNPNLDACLAVGEIYLSQGDLGAAQDWYEERLLADYPTDVRTYEFGIRAKLAEGNIREAFSVYDTCNERGLSSEAIEAAMHEVWYSFTLAGSFDEVKDFNTLSKIAAVRQGDRWGYVSAAGSQVLGNSYQKAGSFTTAAPVVISDGEAVFVDAAGEKKLTAGFFLEKDPSFGKIVEFGAIQDGLIAAGNGETWNFYDAETYQKVFGGFKAVTDAANGVVGVSEDGKTWALASTDGTVLTDFVYQEILPDNTGVICRNSAVIAKRDGMYYLLNKTTGQPIDETGYRNACAFYENSYAAVEKDGRWLFVNENGETMEPGDFDELKSPSAGLAAAKKGNRWGYINTAGEWIIEPQFYDAGTFDNTGAAFVKAEENKWQLLLLNRFHHG